MLPVWVYLTKPVASTTHMLVLFLSVLHQMDWKIFDIYIILMWKQK